MTGRPRIVTPPNVAPRSLAESGPVALQPPPVRDLVRGPAQRLTELVQCRVFVTAMHLEQCPRREAWIAGDERLESRSEALRLDRLAA